MTIDLAAIEARAEKATLRTYKYRLKDRHATKALAAHAKAVNQVWNYCVALQCDTEARYRLGAPKRRWPSYFTLTTMTSGTSADLGLHSRTIEMACHQFVTARDAAKHAPRFRSSYGTRRALGWVPFGGNGRGCRVEGNAAIYMGKQYRFFGAKRRPMPSVFKTGAFVEDALGRWWVCFQVEVEQPRVPATGAIGIDLGLKHFAALSDGRKVEAPRLFRSLEAKLATAQRAGNRRRTKAIHAKIANCRKDFHHKLSTELAGQNALIAVGNVNAQKLKRTKMAKSVSDAGWSAFRAMLKYKSPGYIEVDEKFTTQTCSGCGSIAGPKGYAGLNKRDWVCSDCGASHDRDMNSALNILALGRSVAPRGDGSRRAV